MFSLAFVYTVFSKNEMKIESKHELRFSVTGQPQQQSVQVSQGKAKKDWFFKSSKEKQNVVKNKRLEMMYKRGTQVRSWTRDP
jgi:hypothetical protein